MRYEGCRAGSRARNHEARRTRPRAPARRWIRIGSAKRDGRPTTFADGHGARLRLPLLRNSTDVTGRGKRSWESRSGRIHDGAVPVDCLSRLSPCYWVMTGSTLFRSCAAFLAPRARTSAVVLGRRDRALLALVLLGASCAVHTGPSDAEFQDHAAIGDSLDDGDRGSDGRVDAAADDSSSDGESVLCEQLCRSTRFGCAQGTDGGTDAGYNALGIPGPDSLCPARPDGCTLNWQPDVGMISIRIDCDTLMVCMTGDSTSNGACTSAGICSPGRFTATDVEWQNDGNDPHTTQVATGTYACRAVN